MTDRRALSLTVLVEQVNALAPDRDKASDGWIGDASHQTTTSDHNPWIYDDETDTWVVSAQDITNDPASGMPSQGLADALVDGNLRRAMAYDFPASPAENQEYTPSGGPTYVFKSPRWLVKGVTVATISDTAPSSPTQGLLWWNSANGNFYIYYNDGDSSQWVQVNGAT